MGKYRKSRSLKRSFVGNQHVKVQDHSNMKERRRGHPKKVKNLQQRRDDARPSQSQEQGPLEFSPTPGKGKSASFRKVFQEKQLDVQQIREDHSFKATGYRFIDLEILNGVFGKLA